MTSQRDPKFRDELKKLNDDLLNVIETNHKESPYYDFTIPIQDYIKELASLKDKYPLKSNPAPPAFSFGQPTTQTATTTATTTFANNRLFSIPQTTTTTTSLIPTLTFSTTTANATTTTTTTPFSTPFSFTGSLFGANSNNTNTNSTANSFINTNNSIGIAAPQPTDSDKTSANDTAANDGDEAEGDEDSQPPQPNVEKFEETNVKYEVRTKLYERSVKPGVAASTKLLGCGMLFVKELDTPKKLHIIVRQDPDLRRVLLNEIITDQVPVSLRPKSLQILVPNSQGQTTVYFAKVKDDNLAKQLFEILNSVKAT